MPVSRCPLRSVLLLLCLGGCTPAVQNSQTVNIPHNPGFGERTVRADVPLRDGARENITSSDYSTDLAKLALLQQKRLRESAPTDYPIGPGDVLNISVPAMEELANRTVRVSGDGMISLPFVGTVQASGLTEKRLKEEIQRRLAEKYMYDPQVNLFIQEYRSRQVAVLGAVAKPGLYNLASGADTILDMISQAGGMTKEAAERIHFFPAESAEDGQPATQLVSTVPGAVGSTSSTGRSNKKTDSIVIDLKSLNKGGNQIYLALPARPGDVIMVPGSGDVLVEGWVAKPGSYKIGSGMTVLGAVAAAGGPLFAANTSAVRVISTSKEGDTTFFAADLEKIKRGESPDIPVKEGDVIEVSSSAVKLVPYGIYSFISTAFRLGLSGPLY